MITHKLVKKINRQWERLDWAEGERPPRLIKATGVADASVAGIHLLNPTDDELEDAFQTAQRDLFQCIVIHTRRTFGRTK